MESVGEVASGAVLEWQATRGVVAGDGAGVSASLDRVIGVKCASMRRYCSRCKE